MSNFLELFEIELQMEANRTWSAYRFGILVAHSFPTRQRLINYLKEYFS